MKGRILFAMLALSASTQALAVPLPLVWRDSIPGERAGSRHGSAVALDGGLMAIGVPDADLTNSQGVVERAGLVEIHRWDGTAWQFEGDLRLSDFESGLQANARFGAAVAVSGNRLVIGCPGCYWGTPHAYLVEFGSSGAEPVDWYPLAPGFGFTDGGSDPMLGAGSAVALAGVTFAIGAPTSASFDSEPGGVAVGRLQAGSVDWEFGRLGPQESDGSRFGQAVALERTLGDTAFDVTYTLVVGAPAYVNSGVFGLAGRAYRYTRNAAGDWTLAQEFANPNPGFIDALGASVAIEHKGEDLVGAIVLGAPGRVLAGVPGGSVRIYNTTSSGNYAFEREIQHPGSEAGDGYGSVLAIDSGRLLVGAPGRAVYLSTNAGSAYLYTATQTPADTLDWSQRQVLLPRGDGNAAFGSSLAIGARAAAIGAPRATVGGVSNTGHVDTYLCDRILANGMENRWVAGCAGP